MKVKTCNICFEPKPTEQFWSKKASCISCSKREAKKYRSENIEEEKNRKLLYRYGITLAEYKILLILQHYRCAICNKHQNTVGTLVVDHDHSHHQGRRGCKDCVRQLICDSCNRFLGFAYDSPWIMFKAILYVIKHKLKGRK